MAKTDNLTDFLTDLANAIRAKIGTSGKINPQDFSTLIANISENVGNIDWKAIGYTRGEQVDLAEAPLQTGYDYAKSIQNSYDTSLTTLYRKWKEDTNVVYFPLVDTSNVTNFISFLNRCSNMLVCADLNTSNANSMAYAFALCSAMKVAPQLNLKNATALNDMFSTCTALERVPAYDTSKCTTFQGTFYECNNLQRIEGLDYSAVTTAANAYANCTSLRYLLIKNFGKSTPSQYFFTALTNWGVNDTANPDAKQSLIDTFITYAYDRASAGLSSVSISLSDTTKATLTDSEIAQITAKGITIA